MPNRRLNLAIWGLCHLITIAIVIATIRGTFTWLETIGAVAGLYAAWLSTLNRWENWIVGMVNSVAFFILFAQAKLFASTGLQVLFITQEVYGCYLWLNLGPRFLDFIDLRPVTWLAIRDGRLHWPGYRLFVYLTLATFCGAILLVPILHFDAPGVTVWDALATTAAITATFLFMWKKVENWLYWLVSDIVYVPLLWSQGLHATAGLNAIIAVNAVYGFYVWARLVMSDRGQRAKDEYIRENLELVGGD